MPQTNQRTIPMLFENSCERFPSNILMREKRGDSFAGTTYSAMKESVYACAAGLMSIGIKKGDRIALIAEGRNDWVTAELGILYAGAINVPISVKLDELSDLKFRLLHSEARIVIVSGAHAHKIRAVENDLPELETVIVLDGEPERDEEMSFSALLKKGKEYLSAHAAAVTERWHSVT
jgi:long-chain acyl-CoA synthetase